MSDLQMRSSFKNKTFRVIRQVLTIWGGLSLFGVILLLSYFACSSTAGNADEFNTATKSDVRFVLNWCNLGDERIEKVIKSYTSARSFTGDHIDMYKIKISHISVDELNTKDNGMGQWYRCDSLPPVLDSAVKFISCFRQKEMEFPDEKKLRSSDIYVYPWSIYCHGISPTAAELIFVAPKEKMVYYIGAKI